VSLLLSVEKQGRRLKAGWGGAGRRWLRPSPAAVLLPVRGTGLRGRRGPGCLGQLNAGRSYTFGRSFELLVYLKVLEYLNF